MAVFLDILNAFNVLIEKLSDANTTFNVASLLSLIIILALVTRGAKKG